MYNWSSAFKKTATIAERGVTGLFTFSVDSNYQCLEVSSFHFVDDSGNQVVPASGDVSIQITSDNGLTWLTIDGGNFHAAKPPGYPAFYTGNATGMRVVFTGVTGSATGWVLILHQNNTTQRDRDDLFTSTNRGTRRIRVDVAQTGFFEGREFRTFKEFVIPADSSLIVRVIVPYDVILMEQGLDLDSGKLRIRNYAGGTATGNFNEALPIIGKNNMASRPTPYKTTQVQFHTGAAVTYQNNGFLFDTRRVVAASATAQQRTVSAGVGDERGVAAATYYINYENFDNNPATGTLWFIWEDRQ